MLGAGIILVMFGVALLMIAKDLSKTSGDLFALAWIPPLLCGFAFLGIGAALCLWGLLE